jgi:hypothetical protein
MNEIRFKCTERYFIGWVDPRGLEPSFHRRDWYEGKEMTSEYCNHYQRDTPHAGGVCLYHPGAECK